MLPKDIRASIAKSYYLGLSPTFISREYGIPAGHVIMIAKRHDQAMFEANRRRPPRPRRSVDIARIIETQSATSSPDRYYVERLGIRVALPMVSILRERAA
jgi:hypothetical protein